MIGEYDMRSVRMPLVIACPHCKKEFDMPKCKCFNCGKEWYAGGGTKPRVCPKCHVRTWDVKDKDRELKANLKSNGRVGADWINEDDKEKIGKKVLMTSEGRLIQPKQNELPDEVGCSICSETGVYLFRFVRDGIDDGMKKDSDIFICELCKKVASGEGVDKEIVRWLSDRGVDGREAFLKRLMDAKTVGDWKKIMKEKGK